jgi:hypothetical protein
MKNLKATRLRHYVSKKGNATFVYIVNGSEEQLENYKTAQGIHYREYENEENEKDPLNGKPIFFTTRALPAEIELEITSNNNVIVSENTDDVAAKVLQEEDLIMQKIAEMKAMDRYNRSKVSK